jgi:hypothetical protein
MPWRPPGLSVSLRALREMGARGAVALLAAVSLAACAPSPTPHPVVEPAVVEPLDGGVARITLTERAAERIALEIDVSRLAPVTGERAPRLVVPFSSVFYTSDGAAWVYRSLQPLVFVREPISVASVVDGFAVLSEGEEGMTVVTVGAAELYGAESGLGAGAH